MSLYSQNLYGQPSYGGPSYTSPPPAPYSQIYHHPPPPAPSTYHVDAASFRREYMTRLSELTSNCRPMIQHLSILAQDSSQFADIVAQCIEGHIRRVPAPMKLLAFYLLDSISKNVYEPYARRFTSFVVPLFLETYFQVNESIRGKMEEMLLTWRTGSPTGKELFGVSQQIAIERVVWGDGGTSNLSSFHSGTGQITKSQVLSELQFTLGQKERAVQSNLYDTTSQNHIVVLHQLRKLVEAGVSQDELRQILIQLRNMVKRPTPPPVHDWSPQQLPPFPPQIPQGISPSQTYPQLDSAVSTAANMIKADPINLTPSVLPNSLASNTSMLNPPANIANILSSLLKAGVLSTSRASANTNASAKEDEASSEAKETKNEAFNEYRSAILSENVGLNTFDLAKTTPRVLEFLYDRLSSQCKQCGIRFPDTNMGKKTMDDHLDMHFRQNRKANQNLGRGHSRSWFIGIEDWIHDISSDWKGKGRADGSGPLNAKASAAAENAKREAELQAQYVIVPPGDEAQVVSCPICKETLKSEFLEDDEDWVWKNAIKKDDRIYHATCHAQALALTNSFAAKLRTEKLNGSRSGTPEVQTISVTLSGLRSTPPLLRVSKSPSQSPLLDSKGTKRKVDDHGELNSTDQTDSPPLKKVALSPLSS